MPSSGRYVLDISKKGPSRAKARGQMTPLFSKSPKKQRQERLRNKRRRSRIIVGCACVLSVFGLVGGLSGASHMARFAINDISVVGAQAVAPEQLVASAAATIEDDRFHLFSRENMFLYPRRAIEETLTREFPRIKDVSLARPSLLAQAVVVVVEERAPYASWCSDNGVCYLLDKSGFIFAEAAEETTELPYTLRGGLASDRNPVGQWFLRGRIEIAVSFVEKLKHSGYETTALSVDSEKDFSVRLKDGPVLLLPFDVDADSLVRNLETALAADSLREHFAGLEYVDLRFGSRVYYK